MAVSDATRWQRLHASGISLRKIAEAEQKAGRQVSHMTIARAINPPGKPSGRRRPKLAGIPRTSAIHAARARIIAITNAADPSGRKALLEAIKPLAAIHPEMRSTDVTAILNDVRSSVLSTLGLTG